MRKLVIKIILFSFLALFNFQNIDAAEKTPLKFGVHPLYNPQKIVEIFGPICDLMTQKTSVKCILEPSKDYSHYNNQIKEKYYDFSSPNPFQTLKSIDYGYEVFGKWSNDELFKGIILVQKDSGISEISQLKGKKISFPASTALAAAMMPQYDLAEKNLYPGKDYSPMYVGSQDSSILAVLNKSVDAGVTWYPPWFHLTEKKPELLEKLKILHETPSLPNNGLVMRSNLEPRIKKEIRQFFLTLKDSAEGQALLKKAGMNSFDPANLKTYEPVKQFIKKFEKKLGPSPW